MAISSRSAREPSAATSSDMSIDLCDTATPLSSIVRDRSRIWTSSDATRLYGARVGPASKSRRVDELVRGEARRPASHQQLGHRSIARWPNGWKAQRHCSPPLRPHEHVRGPTRRDRPSQPEVGEVSGLTGRAHRSSVAPSNASRSSQRRRPCRTALRAFFRSPRAACSPAASPATSATRLQWPRPPARARRSRVEASSRSPRASAIWPSSRWTSCAHALPSSTVELVGEAARQLDGRGILPSGHPGRFDQRVLGSKDPGRSPLLLERLGRLATESLGSLEGARQPSGQRGEQQRLGTIEHHAFGGELGCCLLRGDKGLGRQRGGEQHDGVVEPEQSGRHSQRFELALKTVMQLQGAGHVATKARQPGSVVPDLQPPERHPEMVVQLLRELELPLRGGHVAELGADDSEVVERLRLPEEVTETAKCAQCPGVELERFVQATLALAGCRPCGAATRRAARRRGMALPPRPRRAPPRRHPRMTSRGRGSSGREPQW